VKAAKVPESDGGGHKLEQTKCDALLTEMPPQSDQWPRYRQLGRELEDQTPEQRPAAAAAAAAAGRSATSRRRLLAQKVGGLYAMVTMVVQALLVPRSRGHAHDDAASEAETRKARASAHAQAAKSDCSEGLFAATSYSAKELDILPYHTIPSHHHSQRGASDRSYPQRLKAAWPAALSPPPRLPSRPLHLPPPDSWRPLPYTLPLLLPRHPTVLRPMDREHCNSTSYLEQKTPPSK
jgi:hypothetical protein